MALARTCSRLDTLSIATSIPETTYGKTHKIMKEATRIIYNSVYPLPLTKIAWKSTYCPVIEAGPFEDCKEEEGFHEDVLSVIEEYKKTGKAFVPDLCDQGSCDGETENFCLAPREMFLVDYGYQGSGQMSSSWIHHRCSREVRTELSIVDVEIVAYDSEELQLLLPGKGSCFTNLTSGGCTVGRAEVIHTKGFRFDEIKNVTFPCLERGEEIVCYDNVTGNQFAWKEDSCTTLDGACYCPLAKAGTHSGEPSKEAFVNMEMIDELTYQLQYENLEMQFDVTVLQRKITQLRRIVRSLILHAYKITADPLQEVIGVGLDQPSLSGDIMTGFVCTKGYPRGLPQKKSSVSAKSASLFPNTDKLLDYETLKVTIPFLKKAPLPNSHLFNTTKLKHGRAPLIDVGGFLDSIFLGNLLQLFHQISLILPWVNLFLVMTVRFRR